MEALRKQSELSGDGLGGDMNTVLNTEDDASKKIVNSKE
jgi:hypothetical protein